MVGTIEWTEYILKHFEHTLRSANIYGAIGVSCYPYHCDSDVWRAFCELWGPLTNTFHHDAREVDISLYDLERIGGLPILGDIYEEFLTHNEDLMDDEKFLPIVLELLRELTWGAFGKESGRRASDRLLALNITTIGELAAFLAFWLSHFVLPYQSEVIRPETFVMASSMASGQKISLASMVLGYIYHGLEQVTSHPVHPGQANPSLPIHYVVGWLAELFLTLCSRRSDSECPIDYPVLIRNAGMSTK
ncbi:hypothetical protein Cgig2_027172 [Carnegiea gigantea]|uniref:Aminotransferase-like plant mobile domain-containing protein n=1 Tax=Carnegiea gigantea TaxID=171969 RepID=A0A9Q1KU79_9CARY|nr:hypothetical protein Cgig2_027172 [Carnegiea gigantea]